MIRPIAVAGDVNHRCSARDLRLRVMRPQVPYTQPERALHLMSRFIAGEPL